MAGRVQPVLQPGDSLVRVPDEAVTWQQVLAAAAHLQASLVDGIPLRLRFLSPTRLVYDEVLVKTADFGVFFRRLLERIDQLRAQFANEAGRAPEEIERLYTLADQVRLVEAEKITGALRFEVLMEGGLPQNLMRPSGMRRKKPGKGKGRRKS